MKLHALLGLAALVSVATLTGCAAPSEAVDGASSDLTAGELVSRIDAVARRVEERGGGNVYVATDRFIDADLPHGVPNTLAAAARRQALVDCAVYGGGAAPSNADEPEQLDKYLSAAARAELAGQLDAAIGDAPVFRLNSFGIGDIGDDFSARCTVGVRLGPNDLLMLQGHGKDRL